VRLLDKDQTFGGSQRVEHETWEVEISYACTKS